ncbi:MAG: 5-guanidino-2-oxopentanoate decarboxylase [Pseudomonadota bacterium]
MATLGEALVAGLEAYGIRTVFGIPGVHTVELYRGLATSGIAHVTPRHEQGAGFMADGYYRATGRVAAAFVITGPGLTNILTPMAQAYADSIPMLVVSSVNRRAVAGMGGDLHEIRNQSLIAAQAAAFSHQITHPDQLGPVLARAWAVFDGARPCPVHIEVPLDLFAASEPAQAAARKTRVLRPELVVPRDTIRMLDDAATPLILAGGGSIGADVSALAERLDAPVILTTNARGVVAQGHPLSVPASPSLEAVRAQIAAADVVLAIGTEIGRTDYDTYDRGGVDIPGALIRIDIDAEHMVRGAAPDVALLGDAASITGAIVGALAPARDRDGAARADAARAAAQDEIGAKYRAILGFLETLRDTMPDAPIVSDSTQAAYAGNLYYNALAPRRWFNASSGYGALGYGLPAAIGAAKAKGGPVICIVGDGGLQFTLADLGTAVEEKLPVILLVWNNQGYAEIKDYMLSRQIRPVGVDLVTPDFVALGRAYGAEALALEDIDDLPALLRQAAARQGPTVIEIDEALVIEPQAA